MEALSLLQNQITETEARVFMHNTTLTYLALEDNPLNVMELERFYKRNDWQTYKRTKEDIKISLKK